MKHRYGSMDLLRAIAILLVVLAHSVLSYGAPNYLAPLQFGGTGVDLFFVLSGWLLGGLLFKEAGNSGSIDIKRFWLRRWMRTLPAYFSILIFSILQRYLTKENVEFPWEYFVFIQNYNSLPFFFVSWSLCVEEQFYIFIAILLALLAGRNRHLILIILLTLYVLPYLLRHYGLYTSQEETHVRVDGCVLGVILAHLYNNYPAIWEKISNRSIPLAITCAFLFVFFFIARYFPSMGIKDPDNIFLVLIFGSWVVMANKNTEFRKKLYLPGAYYIASRSYSLYLLHPEMLVLMKKFFLGVPFPIFFIITLCGSLLLAEVLYRLVELPVMDARERYQFSKST